MNPIIPIPQATEQTKPLVIKFTDEYLDVVKDDPDFIAFSEYMEERRKGLFSETAEVEGDHMVERQISEIPEDLDIYLKFKLSQDDYNSYRGKEGQRWFVGKYPVFSTPVTI